MLGKITTRFSGQDLIVQMAIYPGEVQAVIAGNNGEARLVAATYTGALTVGSLASFEGPRNGVDFSQLAPGVIQQVARLAFAGFDIAAMCVAITAPTTGSLVNFFSFFTIESNLLAIVVLLVGGVLDPRSERWAYVRGAATLYMVITGIVYAALLANEEVGLTAAWVNSAMHQVTPAVLLVDWVCFPPWARASYRAALGWLAFPLVYLAYSLSRGAAVDWYPYPFLDPRHPGGYGRVAAFAVVLALVMALLAVAVNAIGRKRAASGRRDRQRAGQHPAGV